VSQVDLATCVSRTREIETGSDQRRAAQCGKDAALLWWFAGDRPADGFSNPRRIGIVFS
jgi:hypothetical protein